MTAKKGPIESRAWPPALDAFAIDERDGHRVHGYDVEKDLAAHYRFSDVVYLALAGELPTAAQSRAFEVAMCFLLPVSVADGPCHAAVLGSFCGAPPSGVLSTAAVTLADYAREAIAAVRSLADGGALPDALRAQSDAERASVAQLRSLLAGVVEVPLFALDPGREVALLGVLHACGLTTALQLSSALTIARLPSAAAEAAPRSSAEFVQKYPMNTPPFTYEE